MPTFQDHLNAIRDAQQHQQIRLQLMREIEQHTGRWLIVYAANFRRSSAAAPNSIEERDIIGFSDLIEGADGQALDILIHSPGGSAEVTEQIVSLLRSNFTDLRFIVPHMAMSAATMMCLAGNWILMDERSALGPIDPQIQITFHTPQGPVREWFPAQVVINEFEKAQQAIAGNPSLLPVFLPWLAQFGPYVQVCQNAIDLSKELAKQWIRDYMLAGWPNAEQQAEKIATFLADHNLHKSHAPTIRIAQAIEQGLNIWDLRQGIKLRDFVWKLYCAIDLYFDRTPAVKLFENAHGVSWARNVVEQVAIQIPMPPQAPQPPGPRP